MFNKNSKTIASLLISIIIAFLFGGIIYYYTSLSGKIYPKVNVAGISLSGLTENQAAAKLEHLLRPNPTITLAADTLNFELESNEIELKYEAHKTAKQAFNLGRGRFFARFSELFKLLFQETNLPIAMTLNEEALDKKIELISQQLDIPEAEPEAKVENEQITVNPGKNGQTVNTKGLKNAILDQLQYAKSGKLDIPIETINVQLNEEEVALLGKRAEKAIGKEIKIEFDKETFTINDSEIVNMLLIANINRERLETTIHNLAERVERPAQNAKFVFDSGKVKEFNPAVTGIEVQKDILIQQTEQAVIELLENDIDQKTIALPVKKIEPEISTEEVNNLGIKELIGKGSSRFRGSIPSRVHNIALATSRLNGLLIKPGETFSFNQALGDISVYTGYRQAYVISGGRTILGDGGGVCQVSTTFFRAALASGLPIIERHPHSYRVGYYEQDSRPGLDATIYHPSVDLKIKNDTETHILIQAIADTRNQTLAFEFYGTSDGRTVSISTPRMWDIIPAPPDLYQDDPTLPEGTIKQVDFAATGAKASFDYKVTRGEEVLQNRTFYSNFRPWQAIYLRGTATQ